MLERIHLTILREVRRQGSLTAAARTLHVTQSALSHTIRKLETRIGASLWMRDGRGVRFTRNGEYLLSVAERLLPQLERADTVARQFGRGEKGSLRIGMECYPCYQWLLKIVEPFLQGWPEVDIDVKQRFQFGGMAALLNYDIDILVTPDPLQREGIVFVPVQNYELVLVVGNDHPLARSSSVIPGDLESETVITYPVETERLDLFTEFLAPAHCRPARHKTMESTEILLQMVAAGRGVSALPLWLVQESARRFAVRPLRLGGRGIHKSIHLGYRTDQDFAPFIQSFLTLAKDKIQSASIE